MSLPSHRTGRTNLLPEGTILGERLQREFKTIAAMLRIYCKAHHATSLPTASSPTQTPSRLSFCPECQGLLDYAQIRLQRCRFGEEKPTCVQCPVHCYQKDRREQVRRLMRYAGPRMLLRHPILTLRHWWDGTGTRAILSAF